MSPNDVKTIANPYTKKNREEEKEKGVREGKKIRPLTHHTQRTNSKLIQYLNVRTKAIKHLKYSVG